MPTKTYIIDIPPTDSGTHPDSPYKTYWEPDTGKLRAELNRVTREIDDAGGRLIAVTALNSALDLQRGGGAVTTGMVVTAEIP